LSAHNLRSVGTYNAIFKRVKSEHLKKENIELTHFIWNQNFMMLWVCLLCK